MKNKIDYIPKVFISYAWTSDDYTERVINLSKRLIHDGIDVVIDKWDLSEGQDKYEFMEKSVSDPEINKVLILCNSSYMERANQRMGGVGDETSIITPKIYGNSKQTKFLPIIFGESTRNESIVPIYLESRIYIDLSDENNSSFYEKNYELLIRNIWEKPQFEKPKLGKKPEWLENNDLNLILLEKFVNNYKNESYLAKKNVIETQIIEEFIERVKETDMQALSNKTPILDTIDMLLPHRNIFLEYLEIKIIENEDNLSDSLINIFEKIFNEISNNNNSWYIKGFEEPRYFLIWELFICKIALLNKYNRFEVIFTVTTATYYLYDRNQIQPKSFTFFRPYFEEIDKHSKIESSEFFRKISVPGAVLMTRGKTPSLHPEKIAEADEMLVQLSVLFKQRNDHSDWFSYCYMYSKGTPVWNRLLSKSFCNILMKFIECSSYEDLKKLILERVPDKEFNFKQTFRSISRINSYIPIDKLATKK